MKEKNHVRTGIKAYKQHNIIYRQLFYQNFIILH